METMIVKVLVVDDEPVTGLFLKSILEQVPGVEIAEVITNSLEVAGKVDEHEARVVFLDIDMPELNGLELARSLRYKDESLCLVFATAHVDYALEAFELYSFDYILKPFNEERIKKTMQKIREGLINNEDRNDDLIIIQEEERQIVIRADEIIYVESLNHKVRIVTGSYNEIIIHENVQSLEKSLSLNSIFFRCHHSFLVNTDYVKMIVRIGRSYDLLLTTGERIPLSRRRLAELKNLMNG
ncbi:MAG: response regulator transcription factor [Syntrophomonadaceae bacterium]|nr:response regulator transcription factor [Syntrophomonadaceae bacterium]